MLSGTKAIGSIVALVVILLTGCLPIASAQGSQLLLNGNFEGNYTAGIADGWGDNSSWANVKVRYSSDRTDAHHGTAQKIECLDFKSGAVQFVQFNVPLVHGHIYEARLWLKGDVRSPVEVLLRKHGSPYSVYFSNSFDVNGEWREYTLTGVADSDDTGAMFMIKFAGTGALWVDDAQFTDVTNRVSTAAAVKGNLLSNGSFETGVDRWGVQFSESDYGSEMAVEMLDRQPAISHDNVKFGASSLLLDIPDHGRFVLTSPYVRVNPGRLHTLSLWAASEQPRTLRIGIASGYFGKTREYSREIKIWRGWQRYTFSAQLPPAPENAYYVMVDGGGAGRIWFDGIQLEEGEASNFSPHSPVEIGLVRENTPTLYEVGEAIRLRARLSVGEAGGDVTVAIKAVDYHGHITELRKETLRVGSHSVRELTFTYPSTQSGYYRIIAEARRNGKILDVSEMAIGIVPLRDGKPSPVSPFGNHARFNRASLDEALKLGVSWLRMHPPLATKWFVVEKDKGHFVYPDEAVALAKGRGFNILGSLDTTPRWASSAPSDLKSQEADGFRSYPARDLADWERYVYQTVLHFKGVIDYWEVWNEPDSSFLNVAGFMGERRKPAVYAELLKAAYRAAKRANPDAVIVAGCSSSQTPEDWVEKIFSEGAYDYMDVLSFHYYTDGRPGDELGTPTSVHINKIRGLMRKYGKGRQKPIWETESGIMFPGSAYGNLLQVGPGYRTPEDAATYLVRNYIHLLSSGVEKWFYYSMVSSHRIDRAEATGFFEWDGSPRPAAVAYAQLAWALSNTRFSRVLSLPTGLQGAEFIGPDRAVQIVWDRDRPKNSPLPVLIRNPGSYSEVVVYDMMGAVLERERNVSAIRVAMTQEPVYVIFRK